MPAHVHPNAFILLTVFAFVTILLIFGMKYFSAARQIRIRLTSEDAYRELAEKTAIDQSTSAALLATVQANLSEMKSRLTTIEKVLREVE